MAGDDGLVHGAHADKIGAKSAERAYLGRCFKAGAKHSEVDAFGQREVELFGFGMSEGAQLW